MKQAFQLRQSDAQRARLSLELEEKLWSVSDGQLEDLIDTYRKGTYRDITFNFYYPYLFEETRVHCCIAKGVENQHQQTGIRQKLSFHFETKIWC